MFDQKLLPISRVSDVKNWKQYSKIFFFILNPVIYIVKDNFQHVFIVLINCCAHGQCSGKQAGRNTEICKAYHD